MAIAQAADASEPDEPVKYDRVEESPKAAPTILDESIQDSLSKLISTAAGGVNSPFGGKALSLA
jgi:hypothetical protein